MASALVAFLALVLYVMEHSAKIASRKSINFNVTVAQDGSGNYTTIGDAIAAAPMSSTTRYYIRIKPGTYHEHVEVGADKTYLALIGDDVATTKIIDNRSNWTGVHTIDTATLSVNGEGFMAQFLTIENSAGPQNGQAAAVKNDAKFSVFYKCIILGYQDTLYIRETKQFYKDCDIYGIVDFIFGAGKAVLQDCNIYGRLANSTITVTAQSKEKADDKDSGFSFQNCKVTAAPKLAKSTVKMYLGRPWKEYSTVIFLQSYSDIVVDPKGWLEWPGKSVNHLFYGEYNNRGPGANTSQRVKWRGYKHIKLAKEATQFTVTKFIDGDAWLPETGVPYLGGLFA